MYGSLARIQRVLKIENIVAKRADLVAVAQKISDQIDAYTTRGGFPTDPTPVDWTKDAPLGSLLPLPDFQDVTTLVRYGDPVDAADYAKIQIGKHGSPPYQAIQYRPAGVPTSWQDGHADDSAYGAVALTVVPGWPSVPTLVADAVERATIRSWRQRAQMYEDTAGGVAALGLQVPPGMALDKEVESDVATFVRKPGRVVVG